MPSTAEKVASSIRERILSGELRLGEHVREIDLCNLLHVSRTPVREAFRILQSEGYLKHTANAGVIVTPIMLHEVVQIIEVRFTLETLAAKHAVKHITPEAIEKLKAINQKLKTTEPYDQDAIAAIDVAFHNLIAKAANNNILYEMLISTYNKNAIIFKVLPIKQPRTKYMYKEHNDIITGLESGDQELASRYTEVHFYNSTKSFKQKVCDYVQKKEKELGVDMNQLPLIIE